MLRKNSLCLIFFYVNNDLQILILMLIRRNKQRLTLRTHIKNLSTTFGDSLSPKLSGWLPPVWRMYFAYVFENIVQVSEKQIALCGEEFSRVRQRKNICIAPSDRAVQRRIMLDHSIVIALGPSEPLGRHLLKQRLLAEPGDCFRKSPCGSVFSWIVNL